MKDLIFDFETMGSEPTTCAALDVSVMVFDWDRMTSSNPYTVKDIKDTKTFKLSVVDQVKNYGWAVEPSVIEFWQSQPKNVKAIKVKNLKTNEIQEIKIDGLFIAIGHDPATALFKEQLDMDKEGYLLTKPDSTETNIPGVYAAGDVKDKTFRQAVTAAGMGCMAALEAEKFLSH